MHFLGSSSLQCHQHWSPCDLDLKCFTNVPCQWGWDFQTHLWFIRGKMHTEELFVITQLITKQILDEENMELGLHVG